MCSRGLTFFVQDGGISGREGTVHVVAVNMQHTNPASLHLCYGGHYFAGPDNGIFPLAISNMPRDDSILAASGKQYGRPWLLCGCRVLREGHPLNDRNAYRQRSCCRICSLPFSDSGMIRNPRQLGIDHFEMWCWPSAQKNSPGYLATEFRYRIRSGEHISQIPPLMLMPEGEKCCILNDKAAT